MDRRLFITRGAGASALVVGSSTAYVGLRDNTERPSPLESLHVLDETSFGILAIFAAQMVPLKEVDPVRLAHRVDSSLRYATPEAQADFRRALQVFENGLMGLWTHGSPQLFSELLPRERDQAIRAWTKSRVGILRGAIAAVRKLCLGNYYAPLETSQSLGYPGPPIPKTPPSPIQARSPLASPWVAPSKGESL